MSLPSFPKIGETPGRDEAINQIISSIAMEELGLSHIINTEGEKLQYAIGTIPGVDKPDEPPTIDDLLKLNKSVNQTLDITMLNQIFLRDKLEIALSASTIQGPPGAIGPIGPMGPQGIQGVAGTVGTIKGSYESEEKLRQAHPEGGKPGDFYYIEPDLFVWDEVKNDWINVGHIAGPQGIQGVQGIQGEQGPQGTQGAQGQKGDPGTDGKDGEAAKIKVGKVTALSYGDPPTVENTGSPTDAVFDFGIPEGAPGPSPVKVYKANLSASGANPLRIPLGNAIYYHLQYSRAGELSLFFRPFAGLTQARCDYRVLSQYDTIFLPGFNVFQGDGAVFTASSPAIDDTIYSGTRETHKTWIRVQNPTDSALWSTYELNLFSSQNGARVIVWVNVIEEDGRY